MRRVCFCLFLFLIIQNNALAVDLNGIWFVNNSWEVRLFQEGNKVNSVVTFLSELQKDNFFLKKGDDAIFGTISGQKFKGKITTSLPSKNNEYCLSKMDYFADLSLNILQEGKILKGYTKIIVYKEDCTIERENFQEIILTKRNFDTKKKI
ncbi:secreted protein [Candidatus Magnetomorum sp. HK-1]|nr:secreted protein [Candidatus Magnetomorum sp. HK-1]